MANKINKTKLILKRSVGYDNNLTDEQKEKVQEKIQTLITFLILNTEEKTKDEILNNIKKILYLKKLAKMTGSDGDKKFHLTYRQNIDSSIEKICHQIMKKHNIKFMEVLK